MHFLSSYAGGFAVQSVVHSLVTLLIVEMSVRIWEIDEPHERFKYRLIVLVMPFLMYPVFQMLNPGRGSFYFVHDEALFSSMRWIGLEVYGKTPFAVAFFAVVGVVSVVVILQEIVPIVRDRFSGGGGGYSGSHPPLEVEGMVAEMSRKAGIRKPAVVVIDDERPFIFTSGTKEHTIVITSALFSHFDARQLKGALAHELAHIVRRSNVTTLLVFFVRICLFYNPVSLFQFRRLVQDDEHICDDITVGITGDPEGLASALRLFWLDIPQQEKIKLSEVKDVIEHSSHNLLLHERVVRLEEMRSRRGDEGGWGPLGLTILTTVVVNYFIV